MTAAAPEPRVPTWVADLDPAGELLNGWQPVTRLAGMRLPLPVWFFNEADCLAFIRRWLSG